MKKVERNYLQMQKSVIQYNQAKGNKLIKFLVKKRRYEDEKGL